MAVYCDTFENQVVAKW